MFGWLLAITFLQGCGKKAEVTDPVVLQGEYKRLSIEMERYAARQRWEKAEMRFDAMLDLNVDIAFEHWVLAAEICQEMGKISNTRRYLRKALDIEVIDKVLEWKDHIEGEYGDVVLKAESGGEFVFEAKFSEMDPVKLKVIEIATKTLKETRLFEGMLPSGTYVFVDEEFLVEPGMEIVRKLSPRQREKGLKEALITEPEEIFEE